MGLMELGLEVMVLGLVGVFSVLILFYFMIKLLLKAFPPEEES
ncbi:OadG-related small transporter subunit [Candidatus Formimonas warabiya]|nr:OadG family protein [Candidatus Formimonas warabiya]